MKKVLLALFATLGLLAVFGGLVAQENIAVWKFPQNVTEVTCVSSLIQTTDCELSLEGNYSLNGSNNQNTNLCEETDNTKSLQVSGLNGGSAMFKISTSPFVNIGVSYDLRCHPNMAGGYPDYTWSYSLNGVDFIDAPQETAVTGFTSTTFVTQTADFSSVAAVNAKSEVWFKITMSGAQSASYASNLDNVVFTGSISNCMNPTSLAVNAVTKTSAVVSWSHGGGDDAVSYAVFITTDPNAVPTDETTVTETQKSFTSLAPGTTYYVYVRTNCGATIWSDWASTSFTTCFAPSDLVVSNITGESVDIAWADTVNTQWQGCVTSTTADWANAEVVNQPSYQATGLSPSTAYTVYVRPYCTDCSCIPGAPGTVINEQFRTPFGGNIVNVNVGDGTATSYYTPFYSLYGYSFSEMLYNVEEIGFGGTIGFVSFYLSQTYTEAQTNEISLYMKNVSRESFSSTTDYEAVTANDIVYSGQWTIPADTTGWITIELDTPFEYDGTSNLMIAIHEKTSGYSTRYFRYTAVTNSGICFYSDSYNPDPYSLDSYAGSKTLRDQRCNIKLGMAPSGQICLKPTDLSVGSITSEGATISWNAGYSESSWIVKYGVAGFDVETEGTEIAVNDTFAVLSGLAAATNYDVYVKAACDEENDIFSRWANTSFLTECGAIDMPYSANFEEYNATAYSTAGVMPLCWSYVFNVPATYAAYAPHVSTAGAINGKGLLMNANSTYSSIAIMPEFNGNLNDALVKFDTKFNNATYGVLTFGYYLESDGGFVSLVQLPRATTETHNEIPLSDESSIPAGARLAFEYTSSYNYSSFTTYYVNIDNVVVIRPASCGYVTEVSVPSVTNSTALIAWDTDGDATQWQLSLNGGEPISVNDTSYLLTGLTERTTYNIYVRTACGNDEYSDYTSARFTTTCDPIPANDFSEGFENVANRSLPECWNRYAGYQSATVAYPCVDSSTNAYYGVKSLRLYTYTSDNSRENIVSMSPMTGINAKQISFWAKFYSTIPQAFQVGYIRDGQFVALENLNTRLSTTYQNFVVYLNEAPDDAEAIAFRTHHASSASNVYIDNINLTDLPTCVAPYHLDALNVTSSSATITWSDVMSDASAWQYVLNGGDTLDIDEKPINLTNLAPSTTDTIQIRTKCSDDVYTEWSSIVFTTECDAVSSFPWIENFNSLTEANSIPNCWDNSDGTTTNDSYKWCYITSTSGNGATNGTSHDGSKCVRFNSWTNTRDNTNMLKTPSFNLSAITSAKLEFWYKNPYGGDFTVCISTNGGETYTDTIASGLTDVSSWTEVEYDISSYCGNNNVVIVFVGTSNYGNNDAYIYLDDVKVRVSSSDNTILSYEATTAQGNAICSVDNENHTISAELRFGYTAGETITPTVVLNDSHASISLQVGDNFVALPPTIAWYMTSADTTFVYKVTAESGDEQEYMAHFSVEACPAPSDLVSEQTTPTNVNLSWSSHEQISAWDFYISTEQMTQSELNAANYTQLTAASTNVTVDGETTYYWYVRSACDIDNSTWLGASFTTWENCVPPTNVTAELIGNDEVMLSWDVQDNLPIDEFELIENFEDDVIGDGSIAYVNDATYPWTITNAASHGGTSSIMSGNYHVANTISSVKISVNYVYNGTISFYGRVSSEQTSLSFDYDYGTFYIDNVQQGDKIINSNTFSYFTYDVPAGTHIFEWRYKKDGSLNSNDDCFYVDDIRVYYMSALSSVAIYRNNEVVDTLSALVSSYIDANLDAGTYCYSLKTICRDDYESAVSETACQSVNACYAVTNLSVDEITYNSAKLSWRRGSTEAAWNLTINQAAPVTISEYTPGVTVAGDTISYILTDLESTTAYNIKVQSNCGAEVSSIQPSITFTTDHVPASLPFVCDFENSTANADWILENGEQTNKWFVGSAVNNGGSNALYVSNNNGVSNNYTITSATKVYAYRTINFEHVSEYTVAFNWEAQGETSNDYLRAFIVPADVVLTAGNASGITASNVPNGWISLDDSWKLNLQATWQQVSKVISIDSVGLYNLVFYWVNNASGGSNPPAAIDNISVTEVSCPSVTNVEVGEITNNSADITWTERGSAEAWQIILSTTTMTETQLANATPVDWSATSYTATELAPSTTYHVYVRANCSDDDKSFWVHTSFSTVANCPAPTGLVATTVASDYVAVEWEGYHATQWTFEYKPTSATDWTVVANLTTTTYSFETEPTTSYSMRVMAVCDNDEQTAYATLSVTTPCVERTITADNPYIEDFESYTGSTYNSTNGAVPTCWEMSATNTSNIYPHVIGSGSYYYVHGGTKALTFYGSGDCYAVLPAFTNDLNTLAVEFWSQMESTSYGTLTLGYIKANDNNMNTYTVIETYSSNSTTMVQHSTLISNLPADATRLVFRWSYQNQWSCCIDDVKVRVLSPEAEILTYTLPTQLEPANINNEAALININVANSTDMSALEPSLTVSIGATYTADDPVVGNPYTTTIDYYVTSEDGQNTRQWSAIIHRAAVASSEKDILSFSFDGQIGESAIDSQAHTVNAVASWSTNLAAIAPTITVSPLATINPASDTTQNFSVPVVYTVTAEDGTTQEWTVTVIHNTDLLASIPYNCGFEDVSENANWELNNGTFANKWYIGTAAHNGGEKGLYISDNDGTSNSYTLSTSITHVYAKRMINVEETGLYNISFDWKAKGEGNYDFLRAFAIPVEIYPDLSAGTTNGIGTTSTTHGVVPTGWIDIANPRGKLNLADSWQNSDTTMTLNAGTYHLVFLWKNDVSGGSQTPAAVDNVSIERVAFVINATTVGSGSITPSGEVSVFGGTDAEFTITPNEGFQISSVLVDGTEAIGSLAGNVYTFHNVVANHTIVATFEVLSHTITATAGANGTITPSGAVSVANGSSQSFTITPSSGYRIASVLVDGEEAVSDLANGVYTFTNVIADHTITASFVQLNTYTIIANYGEHGMISPAGAVSVVEGHNQTFQLTPDEGYHIATLTVDYEDAMLDIFNMSYTFYSVNANHEINVTFAPDNDAVDEYTAGSLAVYPNPNNGMFSIDFSGVEGAATYELIDARGAIIETRDINVTNGDTMTFDHNLHPGAYFVRIITADRVYVEQIVVE